ncbi:MAG TPA: quinol:cytochrome C oxidoreductase [Candidatus Dormibacteraeota bacterium]|nr:quinol:cytochrome C oxidoreductase [Candidatus Dormibacteraeota bacterium]
MSHGSAASPDLVARQDGTALARVTWLGAALGVGGLAASLVLGAAQMRHFYFSWLVAFLYFLSIALGSLFFTLTLFVCRAGWSVALRRVVENVMATLPVFAVLFVPVWIGRHELFVWTDAADVAKNRILQGQQPYLNDSFFLIRALVYFVAWSALAVYFSRQSQKQDDSGDERITRRLQALAAPGIVVFAVTLTLAAVDWVMSLDPEWYSTMIGVYYFSGALLASFAFVIVAIAAIQMRGPLRGVVTIEHVHDLGKLLFGFTVFWAYIAFSQYFLIWYANIPEETAYYIDRAHGSWATIGKVLIVGHFVVPFLFLMPRAAKRSVPLLVAAALWLLVMHFIDIYWCVMPVFLEHGASIGALDATTMLAVGGFFLAAFGWVSSRRALVPLGDPRLAESLSFENV